MKFVYLCIDFQNKLCQVSAHEFTRYQMELPKVRCDRFAYPFPPDARSEYITAFYFSNCPSDQMYDRFKVIISLFCIRVRVN